MCLFKKLHFLLGRGDENTVIFKGFFVCFAFADLDSSSQVIYIVYMKKLILEVQAVSTVKK